VSGVSLEQCEEHRAAIYEKLSTKCTTGYFRWTIGILVVILAALLGGLFKVSVAHTFDNSRHVDPQRPYVTEPEFRIFCEQQRATNAELKEDIRDVKTMQNAILIEIRKLNGDR